MVAAIERLTAPLAPDAFLADYWERRPLVGTGAAERDFGDLLDVGTIDALLSSGHLRPPYVRVVRAGAPVDVVRVDDPEAVDVDRVASAFADGATVVVQHLHHWWYPLAVFCRAVEGALGHPTQVNAYLTPPTAQALPLHHDTHDVFVLQVAGSKRWHLRDPVTPLPLPHQPYAPPDGGEVGPSRTVTLHPGDVLYLPRGWLHEAATAQEESLHLTVGVHVHTWWDAVRDALVDCGEELAFRRGVADDGVGGADLLALLASRMDPADVARRARRRFVGTRHPVRRDQLAQVRGAAHLTTRSTVRRSATVIADLDVDAGRPLLRYEGREILFPPPAAAAVRCCHRADGPFTPADLPGLDDEGRLVLVRHLLVAGFLELAP